MISKTGGENFEYQEDIREIPLFLLGDCNIFENTFERLVIRTNADALGQ